MHIILIALVGLTAGIFSGLLGIGGGIIMVPMFYYILKFELSKAIGTSLIVIIPTAIAGSLVHWQYRNIDVKIAILTAVFAILGGLIGSYLVQHLATGILRRIFAGVLLIVAIKMLFR